MSIFLFFCLFLIVDCCPRGNLLVMSAEITAYAKLRKCFDPDYAQNSFKLDLSHNIQENESCCCIASYMVDNKRLAPPSNDEETILLSNL